MIIKTLILSLPLIALSYSVSAVELKSPAPAFSLPAINKTTEKITLSDYKGKVIYLDFWASWCAPCRVSFPILDRLYQNHHQEGFEVIAINLDEEPEAARQFLKDNPIHFTVLRDSLGEVPERYQVDAMPTSFLIDKKGTIRHIHSGFSATDEADLKQRIEGLLAE
ncbi:MAG: TlpA disulfide reductase family protein [Methylococcales bacterium]|nr:TlpA disulfide reductase family protein [Methylococcales bacterium]